MAKNTKWISLSAMLAQVEPERLDTEKEWLRAELLHGRLRYRYFVYENDGLLPDGQQQHADDLTETFWRLAKIHWIWDSATFDGQTIARIEVTIPEICTTATAVGSSVYQTGAPGRPSSAHLLKTEVERRRRANIVPPDTLEAYAKDLLEWLHREHPRAPPIKLRSAQNVLREAYRRAQKECI